MVSQLAQITANLCKHVGLTTHGQTVGDKLKDGKSVGTDNC